VKRQDLPFVLIGKGDDEIAILEIPALAPASRNPCFNRVSDLFNEWLVVARKIDMPGGRSGGTAGEEQNAGDD
jgi:hypothetical protein